jgi:hypothetical protein
MRDGPFGDRARAHFTRCRHCAERSPSRKRTLSPLLPIGARVRAPLGPLPRHGVNRCRRHLARGSNIGMFFQQKAGHFPAGATLFRMVTGRVGRSWAAERWACQGLLIPTPAHEPDRPNVAGSTRRLRSSSNVVSLIRPSLVAAKDAVSRQCSHGLVLIFTRR